MIDDRGLFIFDRKSRRSGAFELRSDIVSESDSSINVENECCNSDPYFSGSILPFSAICDNYKKVLRKISGGLGLGLDQTYLVTLAIC